MAFQAIHPSHELYVDESLVIPHSFAKLCVPTCLHDNVSVVRSKTCMHALTNQIIAIEFLAGSQTSRSRATSIRKGEFDETTLFNHIVSRVEVLDGDAAPAQQSSFKQLSFLFPNLLFQQCDTTHATRRFRGALKVAAKPASASIGLRDQH